MAPFHVQFIQISWPFQKGMRFASVDCSKNFFNQLKGCRENPPGSLCKSLGTLFSWRVEDGCRNPSMYPEGTTGLPAGSAKLGETPSSTPSDAPHMPLPVIKSEQTIHLARSAKLRSILPLSAPGSYPTGIQSPNSFPLVSWLRRHIYPASVLS